jgi:hypothetical protein
MKFRGFVLLFAAAGMLAAQQIKLPAAIEKLADKASETVNVTLDASTLAFASKFLSNEKGDADIKRIANKLKGIIVRSFEFDKAGEYSDSDINEIRAQLKSPEWSAIVSTRSRKGREISEVYLHKDGGLFIIAAEPRELTIVNILGHIDPGDISNLSGQFGIPKLDNLPNKGSSSKKDEEE